MERGLVRVFRDNRRAPRPAVRELYHRFPRGPDLGYNEIEDQLCGTEDGEHYEGNVAAGLWDLADDPATFQGSDPEAWDTVQDNEDLTFMVFDAEFGGGGAGGGAWVPTLCTFVDHGWDDYGEHRTDGTDEIDPLLSHMNVEC